MKTFTHLLVLSIVAIIAAGVFSGCDKQSLGFKQKADAVAVLIPTKDSTVTGQVTFTKKKDGVRVIANLVNLSPGAHGIHIHSFGDCRAADGSSAGDHFNPHGKPHGGPEAHERHVGDLGNIIADESGAATLDIVTQLIALDGENSIIGRGVVVHANPDDLKTQPSGGAGARLACGTIGMARQ